MTWKLFLDDERDPVSADWHVARSTIEAMALVRAKGVPVEMALDHDLGGDDTTMEFLKELATWIDAHEVVFPAIFMYTVHSQNPVGAANIRGMLDNMIRHFRSR